MKESKSKEVKKIQKLSLEQIEQEMTQIALTTDLSNFFINSKKMELLEKIGNFKAKRIQIEQQQQLLELQKAQLNDSGRQIEAIPVKFIAPSESDKARVERIKAEVEDSYNGTKNNA